MGRLAGRGLPSRLKQSAPRLRAASVQAKETPGRRSVDWLHTARWQKLRGWVLQRDLYTCRQTGVALVGKHPAWNSPVVDHIIPHRGNEALFWDPGNLQAVSKAWHDSVKQSMEKSHRV